MSGNYQTREQAPGAIAALVLGIVSLFTLPIILSIPAIILGGRAEKAAPAEPRYDAFLGRVGKILGWISLVLGVIGVVGSSSASSASCS